MTINFPVPPAIHLLQTLLERAEERHRERRANGESSSSSSSDDDDDDDEGQGGGGLFGPGGLFGGRGRRGEGSRAEGDNAAESGEKKKKRSEFVGLKSLCDLNNTGGHGSIRRGSV